MVEFNGNPDWIAVLVTVLGIIPLVGIVMGIITLYWALMAGKWDGTKKLIMIVSGILIIIPGPFALAGVVTGLVGHFFF